MARAAPPPTIEAGDFIARLLDRPPANAPQEYALSGTSAAPLVVRGDVSLRGRVIDLPLRIEHVRFLGHVDLAEAKVEGALRIEHCRFDAGARLRDLRVAGGLFFRFCRLIDKARRWADFRRLCVAGITEFTLTRCGVGLDLANAVLEDDVRFDGYRGVASLANAAQIRADLPEEDREYLKVEMLGKAINLEGVDIRRHLYCYAFANRSLRVRGRIDLRGRIGGSVAFVAARVKASTSGTAITMGTADVAGSVFFVNGTHVTGSINLRGKIGRNVEFQAVRVEAEKSGIAIDMDGADVAGAVLLKNGTHVTGSIDLRGKIGENVEFLAVTIEAEKSGIAIDMDGADVAGAVLLKNGTRLIGGLSCYSAHFRQGIFATSDSKRCAFSLPRQGDVSRELLVDGNVDLSYATIDGPSLFHQASIAGRVVAKHLTVDGDLDFCGSEIGLGFSSPADESGGGGEAFIDTFRRLTDESERSDVRERIQRRWMTWPPDQTRAINADTAPDPANRLDLEMAEVNGHLWMKFTRLHGSALMEDVRIVGEANFEGGAVAGNLRLRLAVVEGRVFADETAAAATAYPQVCGHVDLSYSKLSQVDLKFDRATTAIRPSYLNLTGADVGTLRLRGDARLAPGADSRGTLITDGLAFRDITVDTGVYEPRATFGPRDAVRVAIWIALVSLVARLAEASRCQELEWMLAVYALFCSVMFSIDVLARLFGRRKPSPILDMLDNTYPFSRSFYIRVENWLRASGDTARADEVFLMRRRRETGTRGPRPRALEASLTDAWQPPSGARRIWNACIADFAIGFGVRWPRMVHLYVILFLINIGVFLSPASVERPLAYAFVRSIPLSDPIPEARTTSAAAPLGAAEGVAGAPRSGADTVGIDGTDASSASPDRRPTLRTRSGRGPDWPSDGGSPPNAEWGFVNAAFMALRLQVPLLALVAENDWEPSSRRMLPEDTGPPKALTRWIPPITYEEWASLMMTANFVLIPLIVAGLTQQFRTRGDE